VGVIERWRHSHAIRASMTAIIAARNPGGPDHQPQERGTLLVVHDGSFEALGLYRFPVLPGSEYKIRQAEAQNRLLPLVLVEGVEQRERCRCLSSSVERNELAALTIREVAVCATAPSESAIRIVVRPVWFMFIFTHLTVRARRRIVKLRIMRSEVY
jgi:hypothetical protein